MDKMCIADIIIILVILTTFILIFSLIIMALGDG